MQAPHDEVSQPMLVPVSPTVSRMKCTNSVRGSMSDGMTGAVDLNGDLHWIPFRSWSRADCYTVLSAASRSAVTNLSPHGVAGSDPIEARSVHARSRRHGSSDGGKRRGAGVEPRGWSVGAVDRVLGGAGARLRRGRSVIALFPRVDTRSKFAAGPALDLGVALERSVGQLGLQGG